MADKSKVSKKRAERGAPKKITLIVSEDKTPTVPIKPGMKLDVVSVSLQTPALKKAKPIGAWLCGGTNTCIALTEVGDE